MGMSLFTRRFAAWLACFAILLAAMAPSISRTLAAASHAGAGWAEVCSDAGAKLVKLSGGHAPASPSPADPGLHAEHCPFCSTHAGTLALPPGLTPVLPLALGSPVLPSLYYQAPRPLFIWAAAQSRAPPVLS